MKRTFIILIFVIVSILIGIFIMQTGRKKNNKVSTVMENPLANIETIDFNFKKKLETDSSEPIKPNTKNEADQVPKLSKIIPKSPKTVKKSITTGKPKIVAKIEKDDGKFYYIQVASYQEIEKAYSLKEKLQEDFIKVQIFKATIPNKGLWYRVKIGPVKSTLKKQYKKILNDKYHIKPLITEVRNSVNSEEKEVRSTEYGVRGEEEEKTTTEKAEKETTEKAEKEDEKTEEGVK